MVFESVSQSGLLFIMCTIYIVDHSCVLRNTDYDGGMSGMLDFIIIIGFRRRS